MKPSFVRLVALVSLTCVFGTAIAAESAATPPGLDDLLSTPLPSPESVGMASVRYNALRETGLTYGAQAGLARRTYENLQRLEKQAARLDEEYPFQALMLDGNVLPPVLIEASDIYDQSSDDMLRVIGKLFHIDQQARFVYAPPTWRSYLMLGYDFDKNITAAVSPQTSDERALWKSAVEEGFKLGAAQADSIMRENSRRLKRDFTGMVLYRKMLNACMVTKPFVGSTQTNVTRSEDGSMHVGETFLRITAMPDFVSDPSKWSGCNRAVAADRLKSAADPQLADRLLKEAQRDGIVKEKGR